MTDGLKQLEIMAGALLADENLPEEGRIREIISVLRHTPLCSGVTDDEAEALARLLEERHGVVMTVGALLKGERWEPWLDAAKAGIQPYYWDRYRRLLAEKGLSGQVIATLDQVTDRILGLLENPKKDGPWDRRGMVVGHVQSGKTANYAGLICKASDAGYRLVVVIAGVHNNLRNQTQQRMDEAVVGADSARLSRRSQQPAGVGRFDFRRRPVTFTSSVRDFNKTTATGVGVPLRNLTEPALFVIKKNSSTLRNLLEWLGEHNAQAGKGGARIEAPMLLIDDEADNASINTKHGTNEVTRINGQIRDLLHMFERSCYVGYTATPFANIFIDPDTEDEMLGADLFPRDFIVSLDPPSNYFGAERIFRGRTGDRAVRYIDDNEDLLPLKHTIDWHVHGLPASLRTALRTFVVARAIRLAREQQAQHCSMLVNASRFTNVQQQIANAIHQELDAIRASVRINGALPVDSALRNPDLASLHDVWCHEYKDSGEFEWSVIQERLHEALAPISVVVINSGSTGTLNYLDHERTGLNVVAVGGFSLSRGLTLEGLMVSYFLRNSIMYDTLMQMGRWFGFRPGYEDLCRIWMPEEAEGWYSHITDSIEELREELRVMEAANSRPEEFGLKVRSHPDTLMVTARNKMGTGEVLRVRIGLANRFVETATLLGDGPSLEANRRAVHRLAERLSAGGHSLADAKSVPGGLLITGAPVGPIVDFITEFKNHPASILTDPSPLRRYIRDRSDAELATWDVLFASLGRSDSSSTSTSDLVGVPINCEHRSAGNDSDASTLRITNKQRVASRGVERTGLTDSQVIDAQAKYREGRVTTSDDREANYPDHIYRKVRVRPLLIVHLLAIEKWAKNPDPGGPVVAYSISFPHTAREEELVEYLVNTTWLRENYQSDLDEQEMVGDDDSD